MKSFIKLTTAAGILFAVSAFSAGAASTNIVQYINLQLTLLTQGPFKTNSQGSAISATVLRTPLTTKSVIALLGAAMNPSGATNTFSAKARLARVEHVDTETNYTSIEIRDGTNAPVDVSAFFTGTDIVGHVHNSTYHVATGLSNGEGFGVLHLRLTNAPPYALVSHFAVSGLAKTSFVNAASGKTLITASELDADTLAGTGAGTNGVTGIIEGAASIHGSSVEVK